MSDENVVDFEVETLKRKGEIKLKLNEVCEAYYKIMQGGATGLSHAFPHKYAAIDTETPGRRLVVRLGPNKTVSPSSIEAIANDIVEYGNRDETKKVCRDLLVTKRGATEVADFWLAAIRPIKTPKPFAFKSDPSLTYHRLEFDPEPGEHRTWDSFLSRMTGAKTFLAFIGSLFDPKSDRQQYFWLYGEGGDGKSAVIRMLTNCLGPAAVSLQAAPNKNNKHWAIPYVNVRFVAFTDFDDYSEINKGPIKSLTGGDSIECDPKGKASYQFRPICKLLFSSNGMPNISSIMADIRRMLLGKMRREHFEYDPEFEEKLWREMRHFIYTCMQEYKEQCPNHGPIPLADDAKEALADWMSLLDQPFEAFFQREFEIDPLSGVSYEDIENRLRFRWPFQVDKIRRPFTNWIQQTKKIELKRCKERGPNRDKIFYHGIRLKDKGESK